MLQAHQPLHQLPAGGAEGALAAGAAAEWARARNLLALAPAVGRAGAAAAGSCIPEEALHTHSPAGVPAGLETGADRSLAVDNTLPVEALGLHNNWGTDGPLHWQRPQAQRVNKGGLAWVPTVASVGHVLSQGDASQTLMAQRMPVMLLQLARQLPSITASALHPPPSCAQPLAVLQTCRWVPECSYQAEQQHACQPSITDLVPASL